MCEPTLDPNDRNCVTKDPDLPECQVQTEICDNRIDDDGDRLVDCDDPDCANDPACQVQTEICDNRIDDDGDRLVDCEDPDCANDPACQ